MSDDRVRKLDGASGLSYKDSSDLFCNAWRTWLREAAIKGLESGAAQEARSLVGREGNGQSADERPASAPDLPPLAPQWVSVPRDLLEELDDYLLDREDVRDGSDGRPLPNDDAMSLRTRLECSIVLPAGFDDSRGSA